MIEEKDALIRVRDGLKMAARIYRPEGTGPFPTLFATSLFFHFYRPDKIGADTIYHNAEHSSELILPVLNAGTGS